MEIIQGDDIMNSPKIVYRELNEETKNRIFVCFHSILDVAVLCLITNLHSRFQ